MRGKNFLIVLFFIAAVLLGGSVHVALAQTPRAELISEIQRNIITLLAQVSALQRQLEALQAEEARAALQAPAALPFLLPPPLLERNLGLGAHGEDVRKLQIYLTQDKEIYPEGTVTGFFGPLTAQAVRRFQEKYGIETVGSIGPKTRAKIQELLERGAGASGVVPPGLLTAPGIQKKLGATTTPFSLLATTTAPLTTTTTATTSRAALSLDTAATTTRATSTSTPEAATTTDALISPTTITTTTSGTPSRTITSGTAAATTTTTAAPTTTATGTDSTPPVISQVQAVPLPSADPSRSVMDIRWTTNEDADSQVEYGLTGNYGSSTFRSVVLGTGRGFSLVNLLLSTLYHFRVLSRDAAGNLAISGDYTFTTPAGPVTLSPYGSALNLSGVTDIFGKIWGPGSNGIVVGGGLNFSTKIGVGWSQQYDGKFVTSYSIQGIQSHYLTQTNAVTVTVTGPAGSIIEVWELENMSVIATNGVNSSSSSVTFTAQPNRRYGGFAWYADNSQKDIEIHAVYASPPTVSTTTTASADTQAPSVPTGLSTTMFPDRTIRLSWSKSTDNVGVVGYKLYRNGTQIFSATTSTSLSALDYSDSAISAGQSYSYTATAYDAAGNESAPSSPVSMTTGDLVGPWITSLSISPTQTSSGGLITFSATATDADGLAMIVYDIRYPPSSALASSYYLRPNCNYTGATEGTCTITQTIDHALQPPLTGSYVIETIRIRDSLNNEAAYYQSGSVTNSRQSTHTLNIPTIVFSAPAPSSPSTSTATTTSTTDGTISLAGVASVLKSLSEILKNLIDTLR